MEAPMATLVKRDTRRDTNISLDKPIYTISVASEILETHPRTLMMYEHLGLVVPKRTSTNRRRFSQRDVMKLQTIQKLTRHHSVNLAGVRFPTLLAHRWFVWRFGALALICLDSNRWDLGARRWAEQLRWLRDTVAVGRAQ